MTGPIIPADQWPEWADQHCWDKSGTGWFYGPDRVDSGAWFPEVCRSDIPMPEGWDWRVPVMRPSAEEVRAQANMDAGWYARREAHAHDMGYAGVAEALEDLESRRNAPAIDLERGLRDLYRAYVRLLESGRDRITSLGGDCDPVDVMERSDIDLRKVRDLLALIDGQTNVRRR